MAILENCPTEPILSNKYYKLYQSNHQVPAWVREYSKFICPTQRLSGDTFPKLGGGKFWKTVPQEPILSNKYYKLYQSIFCYPLSIKTNLHVYNDQLC